MMTIPTSDVTIPGTEHWQTRDWKQAAQVAYDNLALKKVFYQFIEDQKNASIDAETVEQRERARSHVQTAQLLRSELEAMASQPDG